MPTYGYRCNDCQHEFQIFQSMKDDPVSVCPECQGSVKRLLYPVGVVFKGSGWYVTDSRKPEKSEGESGSTEAKSADKKEGEASGSGDSAPKSEAAGTSSNTAASATA